MSKRGYANRSNVHPFSIYRSRWYTAVELFMITIAVVCSSRRVR